MKHKSFMAISLLATTFLSGCGSSTQPAATEGKPADQSQPVSNQAPAAEFDPNAILKVNAKTEPPSLDPPKGYDSVSYDILNNIMEGLTRLDAKHQPQPAMAESWEISNEGKTYTFKLRDSKWTNGDPVTAHDFEYAWKRMADPNNAFPSAFLSFYIEGTEKFNKGEGSPDDIKVEALDDKTLEVTLKAPTGFFPSLISSAAFFPVHKATGESNPNFAAEASTLITNGPFKLTEWVHDQGMKAVKHDGYWDKESIKIAGVDWVMVNDNMTAYQLFKSGALHTVEEVPTDMRKKLLDSGEAKDIPEASIYYYRMNNKMPPFQNKNIRKAFAYAIDRQTLIDNVVQGKQAPAFAHVPTGFPDPDGKDFREVGGNYIKDNDVETAKALLKKGMEEEGYTTLPPITMTFNTSDTHKAIAQVLQEMYKQNLGVDITLENKEWGVFLAEQRAGQLQFSRSTIPADYSDPLNFLELYQTGHPGNRVHYSNEAYDDLIQRISNTADDKERFQLMHEAEAIFMDDMPLVPIYFNKKVITEQPNVTGIVRHPVGSIEFKWVKISE